MEDNDAQLHLKKRARRRLVGAVFFVSLAAVILPAVMDHDPRPPVQDVEIRIPGQNDKPLTPGFVAPVAEPSGEKVAAAAVETPAAAPARPPAAVAQPAASDAVEKPVNEVPAKPVEKPAAPVAEKAKPATHDEAKRAADILAGKAPDNAAAKTAEARSGEFLVLIGAFSDPANVTILKRKLGELNIRVITEPLDTPQGRKTRVRAGPFPSREAADKALEKMRRIGVSGVVAAKP